MPHWRNESQGIPWRACHREPIETRNLEGAESGDDRGWLRGAGDGPSGLGGPPRKIDEKGLVRRSFLAWR